MHSTNPDNCYFQGLNFADNQATMKSAKIASLKDLCINCMYVHNVFYLHSELSMLCKVQFQRQTFHHFWFHGVCLNVSIRILYVLWDEVDGVHTGNYNQGHVFRAVFILGLLGGEFSPQNPSE